jgi:hypothetical protein
LLDALGLCLEQYLEAVLAHDLTHRFGYVGVLPAHQLLAALHDRHLAAKAPEHLSELEAYVTTPQHQQVLGELVQFHDRR